MLVVEHGVSERLFCDGADFSGDSEAEFKNGIHRFWVKNGLFSTCEAEVVLDVFFSLLTGEWWHMVSHGDTLVKRFHNGKVHNAIEVGLSGEDENEGVIRVHFEVGQEPQFLQGSGLKQVGFIDDEHDGLSLLLFGLDDGLLDLAVDRAFGQA